MSFVLIFETVLSEYTTGFPVLFHECLRSLDIGNAELLGFGLLGHFAEPGFSKGQSEMLLRYRMEVIDCIKYCVS